MLLTAVINKQAQNVMYQNQALGIHITCKITSRLPWHKKKKSYAVKFSVTGTQTTDAITRKGYALRQHSSDANSGMAAIL